MLSLLLYFQHDENTGKKNDSINTSKYIEEKSAGQPKRFDSIRFDSGSCCNESSESREGEWKKHNEKQINVFTHLIYGIFIPFK